MLNKYFFSLIILLSLTSCASWNSNCHNFSEIKVKEVYNDGVIASACEDSIWTKNSTYCHNTQDIYLEKDPTIIYYDGQTIDYTYSQCPIIVGSKNKNNKTYPLVTIQNPNTFDLPGVKKESTMETIPDKTIKNPKCQPFDTIKVFQVLDDFALALQCDGEYCTGPVVYIPKENNRLYYDEQKINPPQNKCFSFSGTYQYENKENLMKTVPKITLINAMTTNPKYTEWKKKKIRN